MKNILDIKNLNTGYGELQVLKNVTLLLEKGNITILMGPNGAGKSTLLKSIFSLTDYIGGHITFEGEDITNNKAHTLLKKGVAFVSQGKVNFGTLSVRDNILLGAHRVTDKKEVQKRLEKMFLHFPVLKEKQKQYAFSLSGGEQQLLSIARALMSNPKLLLMDEPSLGLAPKLVKAMFEHIKNIRDNFNTTILIVEHNIKSLFDIADTACILVQGEVVVHDVCEKVKNSDIMKKVFVGSLE